MPRPADPAGVPKGSFYSSFDSKEALLIEVAAGHVTTFDPGPVVGHPTRLVEAGR